MPLYMDRHEVDGVQATDVAEAHLKDLEIQARYGVRYKTYWIDPDRGHIFCLAEGPDAASVEAVHRESHGLVANQVLEVDPSIVERFLGPIVETPPGSVWTETAFRAVLFTDLEGSTALTQKLGDAGAMRLLHDHDRMVRHALQRHAGLEVKHTGDGIMASFGSVARAVGAALDIVDDIEQHNAGADVPISLRIGISAGEPVTENDDLFGAAVQLAARVCACAQPGTVCVASAVRELCLGKGYKFEDLGSVELKGFEEPVQVFAARRAG